LGSGKLKGGDHTGISCYSCYFFKPKILLILPILIVFLVFLSSLLIFTIITTAEIQAFAQNTTTVTNNERQQPKAINSEEAVVIMLIIAVIILSGVAIWELASRRRKKQKKGKRQYFTELTKKQVLNDQNYKCAICKKKSELWDYDHIDGNRSNNDTDNCQALCPNCHAKKTRGLIIIKKQPKHKVSLGWRIVIIIIIVISTLLLILLLFAILSTTLYFLNYIH
jgi:hypothetical protein